MRRRWPCIIAAKRTGEIGLILLVSTGCVYIAEPGNYRPANDSRSSAYYECYRDAHQPQASSGVAVSPTYGSGYAQAGMKLNTDMLERCMQARGFELRKPSTGEIVFGSVTSPLWIPLGIFSNFGGMKVGGGQGGE